jgi:hypothetical protein
MSNTEDTKFPDTVEALSLTASKMEIISAASLSATSQDRKNLQQRKRNVLFTKLSFLTIQEIIPDPASRVVLVAKAFMDMGKSNECVLGRKVWDCAGVITPDQRRRVLARLRKHGPQLLILDRPGRPSMLIAPKLPNL